MPKKYCFMEEGSERAVKFTSLEELKDTIKILKGQNMSDEEFENWVAPHIKEIEE